MKAAASRAVMSLAICCLGESRREWAFAMCAEFEEALAEGKPLAFAAGCLGAAWREMPNHAEGRLILQTYALALGLVIPMAVLPFALVFGFSSILFGEAAFSGGVLAGATHNPLLAWSQVSALPCLLVLWLMLGMGHLRLAWSLVEHDWAGVVKIGAFIGATVATLFIVTGTLALDVTFLLAQAAAMAIELTALAAAARRHALLVPSAMAEMPAR